MWNGGPQWQAVLARYNQVLIALEVLLTPTEIATDEQEQQSTFLVHYGRVVNSGKDNLNKIILSCAGPNWQYRGPLDRALGMFETSHGAASSGVSSSTASARSAAPSAAGGPTLVRP